MKHVLPKLPYGLQALGPHLSVETLEYHWGQHHRAYVDSVNRLVAGTPFADLHLEELVRRSSGALFDSAAQHFNHSLYWLSLSPKASGRPTGPLLDALCRSYGSFADFRTAFMERAAAHFGSGWAWVVRTRDGAAEIRITHDAGCPLTAGDWPLLACDLWEHAYYIDYRNLRGRYLESFWPLANWELAEARFEAAGRAPAALGRPQSGGPLRSA